MNSRISSSDLARPSASLRTGQRELLTQQVEERQIDLVSHRNGFAVEPESGGDRGWESVHGSPPLRGATQRIYRTNRVGRCQLTTQFRQMQLGQRQRAIDLQAHLV